MEREKKSSPFSDNFDYCDLHGIITTYLLCHKVPKTFLFLNSQPFLCLVAVNVLVKGRWCGERMEEMGEWFFFKLQFSGAEKVRFQHSLHLLLMFKDKRHS